MRGIDDKLHRQKILDESYTGRIAFNEHVAEISNNALSFAEDVLDDLDLFYSIRSISISRVKGFEQVKPIDELNGLVTASITVDTSIGRYFIDMPIPVYKGEFYRPAIVYVNSKPVLFSPDNMNVAVPTNPVTVPVIEKPYDFNTGPRHVEQFRRDVFDSLPSEEYDYEVIYDYRGLS